MNKSNGYRGKSAGDIRTKSSDGIACCRLNGTKPELLLVCKRYTYAFYAFVHAKYLSSDNVVLINMFNCMNVDEKLDILSFNFIQIWYRIYLNAPRNTAYYVAKNKFETTFLPDGGARLQKLIAKSTNANKIWEIPKGRKRNKNESDLQCAIREFGEETGIQKKSYKVFPWAKRAYSYIDAGVRYVNNYYIGFTKYNAEPSIHFNIQEQLDEISDIRWMSIEEIRFIDDTGRLARFASSIFKFIRKNVK